MNYLGEKFVKKHSSKSLRQFYTVPLFWAVLLPVFIGFIKPEVLLYLDEIFSFLILGLPILVILQIVVDFHLNDKPIIPSIVQKISIIPGCILKTDLDIPSVPFVTIGLAMVNCLLFFLWPEALVEKYTFLPYGEATWFQIVLSCFISPFLHGDIAHLTGNMVFLLVFGSALESRLGWKRLLAAYYFFILTSKALTTILLAIKIVSSGSGNFTDYHSLGASGAIAGLMGIFAVRCYFAKLTFSFPLLGFIGIPFEVPGVILIGMYFFPCDLVGSTKQFSESVGVGYWAHVGGYLGGIILGYSLKLHVETMQEALTVKSKRLKNNLLNKTNVREINEEILNNEPGNERALLDLLQSSRWNKEKAGEYFSRLMDIYLESNFQKAVALFAEHYQDDASYLSEVALFRLGVYHYKQHLLKEASWCLEIVMEREGPLKIKSILVLGKVYEALGNPAMAKKMFQRVVSESNDPIFQNEAKLLFGPEEPIVSKLVYDNIP
jgi:membrane associated rhomboid family serine protease